MRKRKYIQTAWHRIAALLLAIGLPALLAGCSSIAKTGSGSPRIDSQHTTVSNSGTETSQKVTVSLTFDRAITVAKNVDDQLTITLNGKAVDTKTIRWAAAVTKKDARQLLITLSAQPTDTDPMKGKYFGLYEGNLVITAKSGSSVSAITDTSGKYAAKWTKVHVQIPSGVAVTQLFFNKGSASAPAEVTVRVTSIGVVRAMTWVQFLRNGQPVMQKNAKKGTFSYTNDGSFPIHNHQLFQMSAEDYAKEIASGLEKYFATDSPTAGKYIFTSSNDTVTIKSTTPTDGEVLSLQIFNHLDH